MSLSTIIVTPELAGSLTGLVAHRRDLGLSQRQAARITGISRRQLQRLEAETQVTPASIRIALMYVALRVLVGGPPFLGPAVATALRENGGEAA